MPYNYKAKDLLKHHMPKSSYQSELLAKYDIVPLTTRVDQGNELGEGSYGQVVRAIYKGKEVAVKITKEIDEALNWQFILKVSTDMPADLKKHLPQIYAVIKDQDKSTFYLIVMELLAPLPADIERKLFERPAGAGGTAVQVPMSDRIRQRQMGESQSGVRDLMKNEEILYNAFKLGLKESKYMYTNYTKDIPDRIFQDLFKSILSYQPLSQKSKLAIEFPNFVSEHFSQLVGSLPPTEKEKPIPAHDIGSYLGEQMMAYLKRVSDGGAFPLYGKFDANMIEPYHDIPEAGSLLSALKYLKAKGITWGDLHRANLMMRPATGDLVIVDVGLYET